MKFFKDVLKWLACLVASVIFCSVLLLFLSDFAAGLVTGIFWALSNVIFVWK